MLAGWLRDKRGRSARAVAHAMDRLALELTAAFRPDFEACTLLT
jgi:hypothetical protein